MLLPYSITNQQQHRFQKEDLEQPAPTTMSRIRPFYRQRHQVNNFVIPPCTSINLYLIRPYHHHLDCLFKWLSQDILPIHGQATRSVNSNESRTLRSGERLYYASLHINSNTLKFLTLTILFTIKSTILPMWEQSSFWFPWTPFLQHLPTSSSGTNH